MKAAVLYAARDIRVDLLPLMSSEFNADESAKAFHVDTCKAQSLKAQLQF